MAVVALLRWTIARTTTGLPELRAGHATWGKPLLVFMLLHYCVYKLSLALFIGDAEVEDTFLEWGTVLAALLAAVLFLICATGGNRLALLLAGAWFFFAMEEISWGQRLLDIESPEFFVQKNYQQETNLHNFVNPVIKQLYLIFNIAVFLSLTWARRLPALRRVYARADVRQLLVASDGWALWLIPLVMAPASILSTGEYVEEQWAVLGLLLSGLMLRQMPSRAAARQFTPRR